MSRSERRFLQGILLRAADDALSPLSRSKAKNAERDFWIALDFHTRAESKHREKRVARDWNLPHRQVGLIASRNRKEVDAKLAEKPASFWRRALEHQRPRFVSTRT
jgi:bisphosphoglycerate-dependent phosphoglycerate mutase